MKHRCYFIILCFASLYFASCEDEHKEGPTLLVGTYRVIDQNIPYPYLIQRDADSIFLINHENKIIDKAEFKGSFYSAGDTLEMKTHSYFFITDEPGFYILDLKDSLAFPYLHYKAGARFKKATGKSLPSAGEVKKELVGQHYAGSIKSSTPNTDMDLVKNWRFSKDSLTTMYSYYYQDSLVYQEQQTKKYYLFERQGMLFFSENEVPENPQMLYQIVDFKKNSFSIQYYRNKEVIEETYAIAEESSLPEGVPVFSKCLDGQPGEYYHNDDVTYVKGNDFLVNKIAANAPVDKGDGYITVHFTVNCQRQVGRLGLEQMDRDFKSTSFSTELIAHIVSEVALLRDWPEVQSSYFFKDVHAFLMFRIEDGKITDLCP